MDSPDGQKRRCCDSAWDFSYGVSRPTRENTSRRRKNSKQQAITISQLRKHAKLNRRKGPSDKQLLMVSRLKQFANQCGDILPFGDGDQTEIRLPLGNKKLVHEAYCESMEKDPTYLQVASFRTTKLERWCVGAFTHGGFCVAASFCGKLPNLSFQLCYCTGDWRCYSAGHHQPRHRD